MLTVHAPAKVNLLLRVLAREASGFHQLETVFASLEFGDTLALAPTPAGVSLISRSPEMGPVDENLAYRAAVAFLEKADVEGGVEIRLEKRIPVGGGLGGGSSDAAATLRGLQGLYPGALAPEEVLSLAGSLGSDVPFFLCRSPLALAWGRGQRLLPLPPLPPAPILLALPPVAVPTAGAYSLLAKAREGTTTSRETRGEASRPEPVQVLPVESLSSWEGLSALAQNDFEQVVFPAYPLLGRLRKALQETNPLLSLLSGSGAALFAVYVQEKEAHDGKAFMEERFPGTRFALTRTQPGGRTLPAEGG